jgi:hypothetical protein
LCNIRRMAGSPFLLAALCIMLSGCATMRYPSMYKVEGKEFKQFKDLDDEKALKVVALIYNVHGEMWEDGIARSIAIEEYQNLLRKRNSKYVKNSGIFDVQYDKVKLATWKDEDLIRLYDSIAPKASKYYADAAPDLTEIENSERIVYVTALNVVAKELRRRDISQKAMVVAGQVLGFALSLALSMI